MSTPHAFSHDPQRCIKCYTCEIACKQWRGIAAGTFALRRVIEVTNGSFPHVARAFHSVSCRHCLEPACIDACMAGAITRDAADGIVRVDATRCDGCRECLAACPLEVPQFDQDGIMHLCDLCSDRLIEGRRPICSDVCPTQALRFER